MTLLDDYDPVDDTWDETVGAQYYLWDGDEMLQQRTNAPVSGNLSVKYFAEGFQTMNGTTVTGNYYYTKDHLGSIREVVASDGKTVEGRFDYDPWGRPQWMDYSGGTVPEPSFSYAGYFQSASLWDSLYLTRYRAYDWQTHQWLSRDPIGEQGGLNLYGYANNDPVNGTDPSGLWTVTVGGGYFLGVKVTIGKNNGQWSFGLTVGAGDGLFGTLNPRNTGECHDPGTAYSLDAEGDVGAGLHLVNAARFEKSCH